MKHRNDIYQRRYVINAVAICEDTLQRPSLIIYNKLELENICRGSNFTQVLNHLNRSDTWN